MPRPSESITQILFGVIRARRRLRELELSAQELRLNISELQLQKVKADLEIKPATEPKKDMTALTLTIIGGLLTGGAAIFNSYFQAQQSHQLEVDKLTSTLIQKAIDYDDAGKRQKALQFYVSAGLIPDPTGKIMALRPEDIPQAPVPANIGSFVNGTYTHMKGAIVLHCGFSVDADGAPRAYGPNNTGLDFTANAGRPGSWWGLVLDQSGTPVVQSATDPAPGFYISSTALQDETKAKTDPKRYVDASSIPYICLPGGVVGTAGEPRIGDFAAVYNAHTDKVAYAIVADVGPAKRLGDGSMALATKLGVPESPRTSPGVSSGITMVVFPNTGDGKPKTLEEIEGAGAKLLKDWGDIKTAGSTAQ